MVCGVVFCCSFSSSSSVVSFSVNGSPSLAEFDRERDRERDRDLPRFPLVLGCESYSSSSCSSWGPSGCVSSPTS